MFDPASILRCIFAKPAESPGTTNRSHSDSGVTRATFPVAEIRFGICDQCGSQHWNQDAETIVEDAFQHDIKIAAWLDTGRNITAPP